MGFPRGRRGRPLSRGWGGLAGVKGKLRCAPAPAGPLDPVQTAFFHSRWAFLRFVPRSCRYSDSYGGQKEKGGTSVLHLTTVSARRSVWRASRAGSAALRAAWRAAPRPRPDRLFPLTVGALTFCPRKLSPWRQLPGTKRERRD